MRQGNVTETRTEMEVTGRQAGTDRQKARVVTVTEGRGWGEHAERARDGGGRGRPRDAGRCGRLLRALRRPRPAAPPPPPPAARARSLMTAAQPATRDPRGLEPAVSWQRGADRGATSAAATVAIPRLREP